MQKHPDDSNTELQQCEKSKKRNDDRENEQKAKERKQKKKKKEEEKTKTGSVTADKKITSCCMMGICQSSYK